MGGFGGERGPASTDAIPQRPPDATITQATTPTQALLYRLSGDTNPLHADPALAAAGGFDRPILHGLCSYGFAARALLKVFGGNDPSRLRSIRARFAKPVFPGDVLTTELWQDGGTVAFRTRVAARDEIVLANGAAEMRA
jgi:acyl dehydratase